MKNLITFEEFLNESLNEAKDEIVFSIDDDKLDQMLNSRFSRQLDYKDDKGDSFYVLTRRDFDRFIDLADSSGFDVDYENSEDSVIAVQEALGPNDLGLGSFDDILIKNGFDDKRVESTPTYNGTIRSVNFKKGDLSIRIIESPSNGIYIELYKGGRQQNPTDIRKAIRTIVDLIKGAKKYLKINLK